MTYIHLSIEEQTQKFKEILDIKDPYFINFDDFSLNFERFFEIICNKFKEDHYLKGQYLDCLVRTGREIPIDDSNIHIALIKERINCFFYTRTLLSSDYLNDLYKISLLDVEDKKKLFHLIWQDMELSGATFDYKLNFANDSNFLDLPFDEAFEIISQYKLFSCRLYSYAYKKLHTASEKVKKNYILQGFLELIPLGSEFVISVTSETERVEIFKEFIQLDLYKLLCNYQNYFFEDLQITTLLTEQDKNYLLTELLRNYSKNSAFECFIPYFVKCDLSKDSGVMGNLCNELKTIMQEVDGDQDIIQFAKLLKSKILDLNTSIIWDDRNKQIFSEELKFLLNYPNLDDQQTGFIFFKMADWLVYSIVLYNYIGIHNTTAYNSIIENNLDIVKKTFKEIRSFANPNMRVKLTTLFLENICNQKERYNLYVDLVKNRNQVTLLPALSLVSNLDFSLCSLTEIKKIIQKTLMKINENQRKYKDGKHMRPLIIGINTVFSQEKIIDIKEKFILVNNILAKSFVLQKEDWFLIEAIFTPSIINHPRFEEFYTAMMDENNDLKKVFQQICADVFKVTNQDRISNYNKSFGRKYHQTALLTYYSKMHSLPEPENTQMLEVLNKYFNSVLADGEEHYKKVRYNLSMNPQLKMIFEHNSDLKSKWEQGYVNDYQQFIDEHQLSNIAEKPFDLKAFIISMIMQNHLPDGYYEKFKEYIETTQEHKLEIIQQLTIEKDLLARAPESKENLKKLHACDLQLELIDAINHDYGSRKEQSQKLTKIMKILERTRMYCEFYENLIQAIKALSKNRSKMKADDYKDWKIVDTDDYWSMFMAGTDIEGSCQRVDGDPKLNKCLMGYAMNGDYRMLAIQNPQGVTVARCMLHLLWDQSKKVAVLFMEEAYPFFINEMQEQALTQLAINRAKYLGLNLAAVKINNLDSLDYYPNTLVRIKGGIARWVYSDASHGEAEDGRIEVKNAKFLYNHDLTMQLYAKQKLYEEALKYKLNIYEKGLFLSASKYATAKQPYGPYSDHCCFPADPMTDLAIRVSELTLKF